MLKDLMVKAKRADTQEWVTGFVTGPYMDNLCHFNYVDESGVWWECKIDADTICRPVGEIDSAGNPIYENDIIYEADGHGKKEGYFYVPKWDECDLAFEFSSYERAPSGLQCLAYNSWRHIVIDGSYMVIGNTVDNPEFEKDGTLSKEELEKVDIVDLMDSMKIQILANDEDGTPQYGVFTYGMKELTIPLSPNVDGRYQVAKYVAETLHKEIDVER